MAIIAFVLKLVSCCLKSSGSSHGGEPRRSKASDLGARHDQGRGQSEGPEKHRDMGLPLEDLPSLRLRRLDGARFGYQIPFDHM